jgi:hypothetical protein
LDVKGRTNQKNRDGRIIFVRAIAGYGMENNKRNEGNGEILDINTKIERNSLQFSA